MPRLFSTLVIPLLARRIHAPAGCHLAGGLYLDGLSCSTIRMPQVSILRSEKAQAFQSTHITLRKSPCRKRAVEGKGLYAASTAYTIFQDSGGWVFAGIASRRFLHKRRPVSGCAGDRCKEKTRAEDDFTAALRDAKVGGVCYPRTSPSRCSGSGLGYSHALPTGGGTARFQPPRVGGGGERRLEQSAGLCGGSLFHPTLATKTRTWRGWGTRSVAGWLAKKNKSNSNSN